MKWLGLIKNHCSNDHHFNYHKIGLYMVKDITNLDCFTPWNVVLPFILYHYAERDPFIIVDCTLCCCLLHPTSGLLKCLTASNFMSLCKIKLWILSNTLLVTTKFWQIWKSIHLVQTSSQYLWLPSHGSDLLALRSPKIREREKLFKNLTEVWLVAVTIHCENFTMLLQSRVCIWKNFGLLQLNLTVEKIIRWLLLLLPQSTIQKTQCMLPQSTIRKSKRKRTPKDRSCVTCP